LGPQAQQRLLQGLKGCIFLVFRDAFILKNKDTFMAGWGYKPNKGCRKV